MTLLVSAEKVGTRLGLALPLTATQQARIEDAIEDAQASVVGFLGRPLVAEERVVTDLHPTPPWPLSDRRAWPGLVAYFDDRFRAVSWVASARVPGAYDVTFAVGLDVAGDPELAPILAFIKHDAVAALRNDPAFTDAARAVSSVSAEGQSVSYDRGSTAEGAAGAPPSLAALRRWKRLPIGSSRARPFESWPYADRIY